MNNVLKLQDFIDKRNKFNSIEKINFIDFDKTFAKIKRRAKKKEYGRGGIDMHRGYNCPSLIQEYYIGNMKRGRIIKNNKLDYDFTYYYDKDDELYAVETTIFGLGLSTQIELIEYKGDESIGFTYLRNGKLFEICQCKYSDKKIINYDFVLLNLDYRVDEINTENYFYDMNGYLYYVDLYAYTPSIPLFSYNKFKVIRDESDNIIGFNTKEIKNDSVRSDYTIYRKVKKNF